MPAKLCIEPGQTYGRWTTIKESKVGDGGGWLWWCRCACGTEREVYGHFLARGRSKGCGCRSRLAADLNGKRFGLWLVLRGSETPGNARQVMWTCRCDCGVVRDIFARSLVKGASRSCGCPTKLPPGHHARNGLLRNYKVAARNRGLAWDLTDEQAFDLMARRCTCCGCPPSNRARARTGDFVYSGIDRVDNRHSYTEANSVPCCETCNKAKRTLAVTDFWTWAARLAMRIPPEFRLAQGRPSRPTESTCLIAAKERMS